MEGQHGLTSCHLKEDDSKCGRHESPDLPKMSECLGDSNIINSKRTYIKSKRTYESPFVEELYAKENSESAIYVTSSSYSKNKNQKDINSKFSLFNDEEFEYFFFYPVDSSKRHSSHESKSTTNVLNLNQATFSDEQNSPLSITNQSNHTKINNVKSNDVGISKLPQNSNISQMVKQAEKIPMKEVLCGFTLLDPVKRFSVCNNQAHTKSKNRESTPAKKTSVVKNVTSSKINSFDKKTLNSRISIKKAKNVIFKSNTISSRIPGTKMNLDAKIGVAKNPSKTVQKEHIRSVDSVDMIDSINNLGALRKGDSKIPLKTVQEGDNECVYNTERKNKVHKKCVSKTNFRNKSTNKMKCRSSSIEKPSLSLCNENAVQNPAFKNSYNIVDSKFLPIIPLYKLPLFPTCREPACEAMRSGAFNHSIQNDDQAVSVRNLEDLVIPGSSVLSNNHSSKNGSEFDMENVLTCDNNYHAYNSTTIYTCKDTITGVTNCSNELKSEHCVRPQTFDNNYVFEILMADYFHKNRNNLIVNFQEYFAKVLEAATLMSPSQQDCDMTLIDFCSNPRVIYTFDGLLEKCDLNNLETTIDCNVRYTFPINFERESVLNLITDYVCTVGIHLIQEKASPFIPLINFCLIPRLMDTYDELLKKYDLNNLETTIDCNVRNKFPIKYEKEFSHITHYISKLADYLIPEKANADAFMSYSQIVSKAVENMSTNEFMFLLLVFESEECSFQVTDVLLKLCHVALFLMYSEYKCRQNSRFFKNKSHY